MRTINYWLKNINWEALYTLITLIAMSSAWLLEQVTEYQEGAIVLYVIAYLAGGWFGLLGGLKALQQRTIDVDLLMILAALGAAYVGAPFEGAMLLFLFSLSNVLQEYALGRTRNAIRALMTLRPNQALVRRDNQEQTLLVEQVTLQDVFIVKPGDRIPLDGLIIKGESSVDQASITGESMPVAKQVGDAVLAGTINKNGSFEAQVTQLAQHSTIAKLVQLVEEAQENKAETQRFLDTAEQYYATGVIVFTLLATIIPIYALAESFDTAFYRAMTLMVAASPCALIISTPASILSAIAVAARKGVLFKGGAHVEQAANIKVVAFDKTGTLTEGKPQVTDVAVIHCDQWQGSENELLALAATVQTKSEHALGKATLEAAQQRQLALSETLAFQAVTGQGVEGQIGGQIIRIGNLRYFESLNSIGLEAATKRVQQLQNAGKTAVLVGQLTDDDEPAAVIIGVIAFADKIRTEAATTIAKLKSLGIERLVMLTGDNQQTAQAVANQTGVDEYHAELLPEDKVRLIQKLEAEYGPVMMVGDGVNDAPALATASIGVAMGAAGTDVALETADVVLLSDKLSNLPYLIDLSHQTRRTLFTNLGFSLLMILLMVVTILTTGLPLPLAVIGHEGGTVLVCLNGLRLLFFKPAAQIDSGKPPRLRLKPA